MKQPVCIFGLLCITMMPFLASAQENTTIGSNMGLDFYSRIDDAGNSLSESIVKRRLNEKGTYKKLGCGASWLDGVRIDQNLLEELRVGNLALLTQVATSKQVTLTTPVVAPLSQCLVERYDEIRSSALLDKNTLESVGNIGLYTDGDIVNSDYDILYDIARINGIIFKQKDEYAGSKNASAKAIADMIAGKPIAALFPILGINSQGSSASSVGNTAPTAQVNTTNSGATTQSGGSQGVPPWAGVCTTGATMSGTTSLFADGFFDDIGLALGGGASSEGVAYTPGLLPGSDPSAVSSDASFGSSQKKDFFNTVPCQGIFCITINMKAGSQSGLGSSKNSIEGLLESHTKMMEPISWSDLSQQKMTNNFYQLPFLNIKFKNKIAGARVFITDAPQAKKTLEKEATQAVLDAKFELDLKCAMNEAGLPGDLKRVNGFIGAGYGPARGTTTENITNTRTPLGPQEMESLAGCYSLRIGQGKKEADKGLSTDLNEIQAFSTAMTVIIQEILQLDKKLDKLPSK